MGREEGGGFRMGPDLQCGIAPLGPPAPAQPLPLASGVGLLLLAAAPGLRCGVPNFPLQGRQGSRGSYFYSSFKTSPSIQHH